MLFGERTMRKTHADKIREAVTDLGLASPREIMDWIRKHYPEDKVNPLSYRSDIIGCSKNHSSTGHYPSMPKFLWFEEDTKKYRLAQTHEATSQIETKRKGTRLTENEQICIDGIPVTKLSVTGQILIPVTIREKMGFQSGDMLAFIINEKGILEVRKARIKLEFK